jgi:hypothetical protein
MRILRFDSVGGASGDMILGSLVALGVPVKVLQAAADSIVPGEATILADLAQSAGLAGTRMTVKTDHRHDGEGGHSHHHHHHHRGLSDIVDMIEGCGLPVLSRGLAVAVFRRLADAEGKVHGIPAGEVHFHEVGATDAIVDVVASCVGIEYLGAAGVEVGPIPIGRGTTSAAHGVLPLPVPAVAEILVGMPVTQTDEPHELVTPTGAAILSTLVRELPVKKSDITATIVATGYGLGHRSLERRSNALRAMLMETAGAATEVTNRCLKLECNLDDLSAEVVGSLFQKLMESGALDVFTTAVQMKKQRPGVLLTVLCRTEDRDRMLDMLFRESTSFGVRESVVERTVLERRMETVRTQFGEIGVKCGIWRGDVVTRAPEYEDCVAAAKRHGVPVRRVFEAAIRA